MMFDRDQIRMVVALVVVAVLAAATLGLTDIVTREPIANAEKAALRQALNSVLPKHANDPQADALTVDGVDIYPGKDALGNVLGYAWQVTAPDGYAGSIRILIGLRPDSAIHAIRITKHLETPGLGDGIVNNSSWIESFGGRKLHDGTRWKVKKDGGDFDQFTGATITPRAVVKAVKVALEFYQVHQQVIVAAVALQNRDQTKDKGNSSDTHGAGIE